MNNNNLYSVPIRFTYCPAQLLLHKTAKTVIFVIFTNVKILKTTIKL